MSMSCSRRFSNAILLTFWASECCQGDGRESQRVERSTSDWARRSQEESTPYIIFFQQNYYNSTPLYFTLQPQPQHSAYTSQSYEALEDLINFQCLTSFHLCHFDCIISLMSVKGHSLQPPIRSQLTDPLRNITLKSMKTSQYQSKIHQLSNQVKILREKLIQMQQSKHSQMHNEDSPLIQRNAELEKYVAILRDDNDVLRKENMQLKDRVKVLEGMVSKRKGNNENKQKAELASVKSLRSLQYSPRGKQSQLEPAGTTNKNSIHFSSNSVTTNLIRQLLVECNEPNEYFIPRERRVDKDQFYQFKNTEDCFQPFFSALSKELKIRLKRCMIKQKELLMVDSNIELGVISPYKVRVEEAGELTRIMLVVTNIGLYPISNLTLEYVYSNDVRLTSKHSHSPKRTTCFPQQLRSNEQAKEELEVTANSIDFKCVKLTLSYETGGTKHSHLLILPLSKGKLFRDLPFTSTPTHAQRVERVFQFERKILSELSKLKSFLGHVYQGRQQNGAPRYCWKLQFMGRPFWVQVHQVQEKMALCVSYENQRALAEKILGEYVFLFQKI